MTSTVQVFLSIMGASAALVYFGIIPYRRASTRLRGPQLSGVSEASFVGGATYSSSRTWRYGLSGPMVRRTLRSDGIVLAPAVRCLSPMVPSVELRLSDISEISRKGFGVRIERLDVPGSSNRFRAAPDGIIHALRSKPVRIASNL